MIKRSLKISLKGFSTYLKQSPAVSNQFLSGNSTWNPIFNRMVKGYLSFPLMCFQGGPIFF